MERKLLFLKKTKGRTAEVHRRATVPFSGQRKLSCGSESSQPPPREKPTASSAQAPPPSPHCYIPSLAVCSPPVQTQLHWRFRAPQVPKANAKFMTTGKGAIKPRPAQVYHSAACRLPPGEAAGPQVGFFWDPTPPMINALSGS